MVYHLGLWFVKGIQLSDLSDCFRTCCILYSFIKLVLSIFINNKWSMNFWWCFTFDRAPNMHCLPLLLMLSLSYGCQSCFPDEVVTLLKPCWAPLNHFSSFSPRSDLSLFMGSPRLQVQLHIKVALTTLFLIGWDEGVMTMQVGEVARIQVYSWDVKLAWLPECVCFTLPAHFICTATLKCCYSWQFSLDGSNLFKNKKSMLLLWILGLLQCIFAW